MARDIRQDEYGDILLVDGDISFGEATGQHIRTLLVTRPGDNRTAPLVGVALQDYLEDNDTGDMFREIRTQLARNGMKVVTAKIDGDGKLLIDAHYKGEIPDYATARPIVFADVAATPSTHQSLINLAIQEYGNVDAILQIMEDTDLVGHMEQPASLDDDVDLSYCVVPGFSLAVDTASPYYNAVVLEGLKEDNGKGVKVKRIIADGLSFSGFFNNVFNNIFN